MDLVSVIVPVYNVEAYLAKCVDSLLRQTHRPLEIILIDDCSTDHSAEIAQRYAQEHPDVCKFVQAEKKGNLAISRNIGMKIARGQWISFVDSDDWVTDDYIESMYQAGVRDDSDIVISGRVLYYPESEHGIDPPPYKNITTESTHKEKVAFCYAYACAKLFRTDFVRSLNLLFPEDIWRAEDLSTIIPWCTATEKISIVPKSMYYYVQRKTSLSNQNQKGVDVSFYPKTIRRMLTESKAGFEKELEFRAVTELLYGMVMVMIRSGKTKKEILDQIDAVETAHPNWKENPYFLNLPKGKRIFILTAQRRKIGLLKLLIWAWDKKQSLSHS